MDTDPQHRTQDSARAWLESLAPRGIQLGLERVHAALARLGDPHLALRCVTIAGTNGKGSTAAFTESMLRAAGLRTGLYTSPHLVSIHERIRVGGVPIPAEDFERWAGIVRAATLGAEPIPLTHFEALTVMAFGYLHERGVDVAVLEVGLGGRLDAVNAAEPLVSVLTSVARDHERILGPRLSDIAREKVAIARPERPLVTGVSAPLWRRVVGPHSLAIRAHPRRLGVDFVHGWPEGGRGAFRYRGWGRRVGPVQLPLRGDHQGDNAALACAAVEALVDMTGLTVRAHHMAEGLEATVHRGRMERIRASVGLDGRLWPELLLDGAHNVAGMEVLAGSLGAELPPGPRVLLFGVNAEKRPRAMLGRILETVSAVVLTCPTARPDADLEGLARRVRGRCRQILIEPRPLAALEAARSLAVAEGGSLIIAGSLYLLGDLLPWLPGPGGVSAAAMGPGPR